MKLKPEGERLRDFWKALMPAMVRLAEKQNENKKGA